MFGCDLAIYKRLNRFQLKWQTQIFRFLQPIKAIIHRTCLESAGSWHNEFLSLLPFQPLMLQTSCSIVYRLPFTHVYSFIFFSNANRVDFSTWMIGLGILSLVQSQVRLCSWPSHKLVQRKCGKAPRENLIRVRNSLSLWIGWILAWRFTPKHVTLQNGKFVSEEVHMGDTVQISLHEPNTSAATSI